MRTLVVVLVAGAVLTACAGSVEPRQPHGPEVTGRMISLDDTGLPPTPSGGGWMLLVPEAAVPDLWAGVGMEEPEALEYTAFPTTPDLLADVDGDVVPVDDDGHFQLTRTGPHLICHLPEPAGSGEAPAGARGCDVVDLPVSGALKVTYGEGGFHAYLV